MRSNRSRTAVALFFFLGTIAAGISGQQAVEASSSHTGGGTLTIAYDIAPDTLNPATTGFDSVWIMERDIFDSLVYETPQGKFTPWLATSWKISNQGKTYTFFLRHGVTFHDGTPFNAKAVVANWHYIENPASHAQAISDLGQYASSKAVGSYQVVLNLKKPFSPLLSYLAGVALGIQSPAAIKKYGAQLGNHPIGTGPFAFVSYVRPSTLTLQKNPNYAWPPPALHHKGPASLDKIVYDIIPTANARMSAFQSGQAQVITGVPALLFKSLKNNPSYKPFTVPFDGSGAFAILNTKRWPTSDLAVRKAILYSIDRTALIKFADAGQFPVTWGPVQKGTYGYDPALNGMYAYNPAKAASILRADGWKKVNGIWTKGGKPLTIDIAASTYLADLQNMAISSESYLKKAGMAINIRVMNGAAWEANNTAGTYSFAGPLQFTQSDPDLLRIMFAPESVFDWTKFNNPTFIQLVHQADTIPNGPQRLALYKRAEKIVMDNAIILPVRYNEDLELMSTKLHGVVVFKGGLSDHYLTTLS
jgi:peptide/nickel transport system substrate-binding protein